MTNHEKKSTKLAFLVKKAAQKFVKNPKAIHKELKKLALTLPLMALLVEEVRAAQKKVNIDATTVVGEGVFEDEAALVEFIDAQNLDDAQYTQIEQELETIVLAKADQAETDEPAGNASLKTAPVTEHLFGDGGMSLTPEDRAAAVIEDEAFRPAGLPAAAALPALGNVLGVAAGVAGAAVVLNNPNNNTVTTVQASGTNVTSSLKELQQTGVDYVTAAPGQNTINIALGTGTALNNASPMPRFGDTNQDGIISQAEDDALSVNLTIDSAEQLAEISALSGLANFGIDSVRINLANQDLLDALTSDNTLAANIAAIRANGLTIDTIDMGSNATITEQQARLLTDNHLHFAAVVALLGRCFGQFARHRVVPQPPVQPAQHLAWHAHSLALAVQVRRERHHFAAHLDDGARAFFRCRHGIPFSDSA